MANGIRTRLGGFANFAKNVWKGHIYWPPSVFVEKRIPKTKRTKPTVGCAELCGKIFPGEREMAQRVLNQQDGPEPDSTAESGTCRTIDYIYAHRQFLENALIWFSQRENISSL